MSTARGQRWGGGKRARRRGRLLESIGGTVPWSAPEQLGVRGARSLAHPPRPNPFSEGEGPEIPGPVYRDSGGAAAAPQVAAWEQRLQTLPRRVRRALQRHFLLSLAELALVLALWQGPAWTAEIPVDGTTYTLAAAITAANTDAASGGCPAGSGADTLVLPAGGTITLTAVDNTTTDGPNGLPVVTSTITIAGQGSTLQRGGTETFRLLAVGSGGYLTVQALTLKGGDTATYGGGMLNRDGSVIIMNSTLSGNSADADGSGVSNFGGSLTIVNSTLSGNSAGDDGGGVSNFTGSVAIVNSTLSGNTAAGDGGGVSNHTGSVAIVNSTLSGNSAGIGGGVFNDSTLTLSQSTLSGNTSTGSGGGALNYINSAGTANLTLANCTLSGNTAFLSGGGVANTVGISGTASLTITHSTLTGNLVTGIGSSGGGVFNSHSLTLAHSLIAGNSQGPLGSAPEVANAGTVTADNSNLFGFSGSSGVFGFEPGASDITPSVALAAILAPSLTFNGGPTQTHDLVPGSPAVDAATTGFCPAIDQRGFARPVDGDGEDGPACDIGAVEAGATLPSVVTAPVTFTPAPQFFSTTTDTTGCDGGVGKFSFLAALTNQDAGTALEALKAQVAELGNGNMLLTADAGPGGVGAVQTVPQAGDFSDGLLEPGATVPVPFVICLQSLDPFRFTVDLLGLELLP
jgi:hypothetical protein